MSEMLFKKVDYNLWTLIDHIKMGEIGLPEIQRPFVWKTSKVRDLFDSMYKGFPIGYLLFWSTNHFNNVSKGGIGLDHKQKPPRLLIVDGQQRLTSLYSVMTGHPILNKQFNETNIHIAFRPLDGQFEVADAAIELDPEYIADISDLWSPAAGLFEVTEKYLDRLQARREVPPDQKKSIQNSINRLENLNNYPLTALEITSAVDEEEVADIFVRINSQGVALKVPDFILTLMSVFWNEGRAELQEFCRGCAKPTSIGVPSPFNYFIQPEPDQLLRVSVGVGFKRARLKHVYSILRGKDLESGEFSDERRDQQFEVLKAAQAKMLDLQNWSEFQKALLRAGFKSERMITSEGGLLYAYTMFLIGKYDFNVDLFTLKNIIARWFFMTSLTSRYSGSPETTMESDLARLRAVRTSEEFVATLEQIIQQTLTADYWNISLVDHLKTTAARSPTLFAYYASLNLLEAHAFLSKMKVSELLDPALQAKKSAIERHHLFPKSYLQKGGIGDESVANQIANFAPVEWNANIGISDDPPEKYWDDYARHFTPGELREMMDLHALPEGWEKMEYRQFLDERRRRIAHIIQRGFDKLSIGNVEG
jgi:hypothetical protein